MRMKAISIGLIGALALVGSAACMAQRDSSGIAGCAACGSCGGGLMIIALAWIGLSIALLVWVARDAKARGMDSAVLWMLMVLFLGVIGLVIYLLARPQGIMVPCPHCGNRRLQASVKCPHCGIGS